MENNIKRLWIKEFKQEIDKKDSIIIDLRTKQELNETWIISWAKHLDCYENTFINKLTLLDKNKKYLIYCRSGNRSLSVLNIMKELWFINVFELEGGIIIWLNSWENIVYI